MIIKEVVEKIVYSIVNHTEDVRINVIEGQSIIIVELKVNKDEIGKVIGKSGSMAQAMRTIVSNIATRLHKKAQFHIIE